jgi:hypothetical protein
MRSGGLCIIVWWRPGPRSGGLTPLEKVGGGKRCGKAQRHEPIVNALSSSPGMTALRRLRLPIAGPWHNRVMSFLPFSGNVICTPCCRTLGLMSPSRLEISGCVASYRRCVSLEKICASNRILGRPEARNPPPFDSTSVTASRWATSHPMVSAAWLKSSSVRVVRPRAAQRHDYRGDKLLVGGRGRGTASWRHVQVRRRG